MVCVSTPVGSTCAVVGYTLANRHNVLFAYDSRLAQFDTPDTHRMSRDQKRHWIKHLHVAHSAYALELKQRDRKQNLITKYMVLTDKVVHSDLESKYDKDIAEGINKLSLHTQSTELAHSNLEGECDEEINDQVLGVHTKP